mmetsp:Transcript_5073/g.21575  ORF Transcript_5073/g.21575 Transcript_5073/m.21575 type:complete len:215 (-) Transcript_5073:16-660(-)
MPITSSAASVAAGSAASVRRNVPAKMDATPAVPTVSRSYTAGLGARATGLAPPMGLTPMGLTAGFFAPMFTVLKVVGLAFFTVPAVLVMVYLDFEAVALLGAAFLAVPKENSGLAAAFFAAGFFATGFFAIGFFAATGFFAAGLGLGLPTMGLTAAFLGAAGAFLPKSATAAWGLADAETAVFDANILAGAATAARKVRDAAIVSVCARTRLCP